MEKEKVSIPEEPKRLIVDDGSVSKWQPYFLVVNFREVKGRRERRIAADQNIFKAEFEAQRDRHTRNIMIVTVFPRRDGGPVRIQENGIIDAGTVGATYEMQKPDGVVNRRLEGRRPKFSME